MFKVEFRYNAVARWLHWVTVLLILVVATCGVILGSFDVPKGPFKDWLFYLHENFGILIFVVVAIRLVTRLINPPAPLPEEVNDNIRRAAKANHVLLYVILFLQPAMGFLITNASGFRLNWFGQIPLPFLIAKDKSTVDTLLGWHSLGALILLILVLLHIAGAIYHGLIRRDGVVQRML